MKNRVLKLAALSLLGWYLMIPPVYQTAPESGVFTVSDESPYSEWTQKHTFDTAHECELNRERLSLWAMDQAVKVPNRSDTNLFYVNVLSNVNPRCVASNDPRLKYRR